MSGEPTAGQADDPSSGTELTPDSCCARQPCDRELSRDDIFDILRNSRRRAVINHLRTEKSTMTLNELAEQIAGDENDIGVEDLSSQQRKRVYVSLHQNHLPKMDDMGVVDYDRDRGTIALGDISGVSPYLSLELDDGVPRYLYVALAIAAAVIVGLSGIGPVSAVSAIVWALVCEFALVTVVLLGIYREKSRSGQ